MEFIIIYPDRPFPFSNYSIARTLPGDEPETFTALGTQEARKIFRHLRKKNPGKMRGAKLYKKIL